VLADEIKDSFISQNCFSAVMMFAEGIALPKIKVIFVTFLA